MLEQLDLYQPGHLESAVVEFYQKNHVSSPQDIRLEAFAEDAGIIIREHGRKSMAAKLAKRYVIFLDGRLPYEQQRVELAHELGHILMHVGRQEFLTDDFRALQEWQADRFAFYALCPTHMIANRLVQAYSRQEMVEQLAYQFDVPSVFMDARLDLLEQRMRDIQARERLARTVAELRSTYDYSFRHPSNPRIEYLVKNGQVIHRRLRADI